MMRISRNNKNIQSSVNLPGKSDIDSADTNVLTASRISAQYTIPEAATSIPHNTQDYGIFYSVQSYPYTGKRAATNLSLP